MSEQPPTDQWPKDDKEDDQRGQDKEKDEKEKKKPRPKKKTDFERPWSWVIVVTSVLISVISFGQIQSVNIYYLIFLREFRGSSSFTAWISASQTAALCIAGPLSSLLLSKLGARRTIVAGSILMTSSFLSVFFANSIPYLIAVYACIGAAESLMSGGNLMAINAYFPQRAAFVTGIVLAGGGLGGMVTGLEIEWAVKEFGWRGAMLVQAAIALHTCVCGSCVLDADQRPKKAITSEAVSNGDAGRKPDNGHGEKAMTDPPPTPVSRTSLRSLSLDPFFWLSVLAFMGLQASFSVMLTIFKGFVVAAGLESSFPTVLTTVGVGSMVGRALSGPISGLFCAPIYLTVAALTCTVANALYVLATVPWALAVVGAAFGFFQGQMFVSWLLSMSWIYGQDKMPVVRGHVMFFGVIASLLFPPLAGLTVDITGDYKIALMMSSGANLCCGICGLVTYFIHRRKHRPSPDINGQAVQDQLDHCTRF